MANKSTEEVARSAGPIRQNFDRCTVVLQAHYLEFETGDTVNVRWAYDRLVPVENSPYQASIRVNPGKEYKIIVPIDGEYELILGHKTPETVGDDKLMKEQMAKNVIELYSDGKLIAFIKPDRISVNQFSGELTVRATHATALLHITALPC